LTKQQIEKDLEDIEKNINLDRIDQETAKSAAQSLFSLILDMGSVAQNENQDDFSRALDLLKKVHNSINPNDRLHDFIKAFFFYISGKYSDYLQAISVFVAKYIKDKKKFTYEAAEDYFFSVFNNINLDDKAFQTSYSDKFLPKFQAILRKYCPDSAFERYIKYCLAKTQNSTILIKYLQSVLEKDGEWAAAYSDLGDLYFEKSEWQKAAESYENAIRASEYSETDLIYFSLGWAYSKLKDYRSEEIAYRKCIEITPAYPFANNNLGYCLVRQQRYEEALVIFDQCIALEKDKHFPYRNKFEALKKLGRIEEAVGLIELSPEYFNTKYHREEFQKIKGGSSQLADIFSKLKDVTESEHAGEMKVANALSGIELYPHQQDAIRAMNKVILKADDYAGLLVLPTGGGKTLTATYWLMQSLLDKGRKIVWLAHRHELLNQAQLGFEKVCYKDIAQNKPSYNWRIISGQHDKPIHIKPIDDIIIASKTSLKRGLNYFLQKWLKENGDQAFLIIDEAHHATASEYRDLIDSIRANSKHLKMLGLTATPFRTADNEQGLLKKVFPNDIVYKIDLRELINRGILSEPIFKSVSTGVNMVELFEENNSEEALDRIARDSFFDIESIGKEAAVAIANNSKRNSAIVSEYVKNKEKYKQTLVFALNVDMAIVLNGLFKAAGIRSDFVVSDIRDLVTKVTISSKENGEKIQKFRDGELDVLVNVNILTEGTDLPKVQTVFLTRPTKSTILMTQMIGRALRGEKAGGTKDAYIVSFIDEWQDKIAWVNPEQLFIDENVDFTKKDHETRKMAMRLVSIAKLEEFAKIANDTIDPKLTELAFIDRIPIGIYKFSYLVEDSEEEELDKSCNVLVYDCMKTAYEDFLAWLPSADLSDVDAVVEHVDTMLFGTMELLLGYRKQDVLDIIQYYKQMQEIPQMIYLSERSDYDVSDLARYIVDNELTQSARKEFIDTQWNRSDMHWAAFFGIENQKAFRKLINDAIDRIENPEDYAKPSVKPITEKEKILIQELPLQEIRRRFPELEEKIRDAVFEKYLDPNGFYHSAQSRYKSRNKLDFQIDHIKPLSKGGLTVLDNLQLLTRTENLRKSDKNFR
jgi:DNA or RNA helicases of superfamily II